MIKMKLWVACKGGLYKVLGPSLFMSLQAWHWSRILRKGGYEAAVVSELKQVVHPGDFCVDIGANVGQYSVALSTMVGDEGVVWSFEPVFYARHILALVLNRLGLSQVVVFPFALSSEKTKRTMVTPLDFFGVPQVGLSYIGMPDLDQASVSREIDIETLDALIHQHNSEKLCRFVKIDVEGHEGYVLRGAKHFLETHSPVLLIEIDPEMSLRAGIRVSETLKFLSSLGYEMGRFEQGSWHAQAMVITGAGQTYWFRKP